MSRAKPGTLFTVDDFEGGRGPVEIALSRLEDRGDLRRIRKGLYFKGVTSRFGPGRPRAEDVVYKVCGGRGVGPSGWTASHLLGLSTQVPAQKEFAIVGAPPTNVSDVRFHSRRNLERLPLNPYEIALIEILRAWPAQIEASWDELLSRVSDLRDRGLIKLDRVEKAALHERSPRLRERLQMLVLETLRAD